jgi:hypothetical protein
MEAVAADHVWILEEIVMLINCAMRKSLEIKIGAVEIQFEILCAEIIRFHEDAIPPRITAAMDILKLKIKNLTKAL